MLKLAVCALLATSIAVPGPVTQATLRTDEQPADTLIVLQLGACERHCPVYRLAIFADGSTLFEGRYYVRRAGVVRGRISLESLAQLLAEADALQFFKLKDRYVPGDPGSDCAAAKSDGPTAVLTISARGRAKTVQHYRGCAGTDPERLTKFENGIAEAANVTKWIR